ncbi:FAD-dependent oxidoreductase [Brevibacterium ravenspurgense]|uniref:FAD-dependent oxidoreductase n=1 Tax=Brevibacterium ravenspurgense TaxID=479117 RepID=UPI001EF1C5DA|nr:FAD-dependent oxidoreductase [Brevibacterium ravenspurgense]MCG7300565.1 FAD-dependent oxidoreductase [Brevibacterium ravenspurgense]
MHVDVVVVGAGGAGLAAAISAAEKGSSVIVFESESAAGGSTSESAGMFTAGGTSTQADLGVEDTVDRYFQHYMDLNQWQLEPGLIRSFCESSVEALDWVKSIGVEIPSNWSSNAHEPGLTQSGVEDVFRGHVPKDQGYGLVTALVDEVKRRGVEIYYNSRVESLLTEGGAVVGVIVDGIEVRAHSTVVATGGFAQNPELVQRYYPEALAAGDKLFPVAAPGSRGDHIAFGKTVNAKLVGEGTGLLLVTADLQRLHHWQSGFPPLSRVYVNSSGLRFMNEDVSYAVSSGILARNGGYAWCIFDEKARLGLDPGYSHWTPDNVLSSLETGDVIAADSLAELAEKIDIDPVALAATIDRWNTELPEGKDPQFARIDYLHAKGAASQVEHIEHSPFYAVKMRAAELVCTHTGLAINDMAEVLDNNDAVIPGLYAAGEAGGGVLGPRYVGGGNAVANALTMGRRAGQSASDHAQP